jgi:hypothetical protein
MNKTEALKTLVKNSVILSDLTKSRFLEKLESLSAEEIDYWGEIFPQEQKLILQFSKI